jgi:hypothetical protein
MSPRRRLHIALNEFSLPYDAITQTFAILAKREAGKTYAAKVLAEEMLMAGHQIIVIDPVEAWWGLRSSADGKDPGFPLAIFGGPHGDIPLEPTAGKLIAELLAGEGISAILSVRTLSKAKRRQFLTDFALRLLDINEHPVHIFIEEAHMFMPQQSMAGDKAMVAAMSDLTTTGRGLGITTTLITQRSARLSKDPLEQTDILVALRTTGPNDRKAIQSWIDVNADDNEAANEVMATIPHLDRGEAWIWAPGAFEGPQRVQFRMLETFDSSATPKPGKRRRQPKTVADIDLAAIESQMQDTIERAEANDPVRLKRRVAELEKELKQKSTPKVEIEKVEVLDPMLVKKLDGSIRTMQQAGQHLQLIAGDVSSSLAAAKGNVVAINRGVDARTVSSRVAGSTPASQPRPSTPPTQLASSLVKGEKRILETLARHHPVRMTKPQLATLSRFKQSGTFSTYLSNLKGGGLIYVENNLFEITHEGSRIVGANLKSPMTPQEVLDQWMNALVQGERRILEFLVDSYPEEFLKEDLAENTGFAMSGTFSTYLSNLRRNGLIEGRGSIKASPTICEGVS